MKAHSFKDSLEKSHRHSDDPIWESVYRQFFVDMVGMTDHRGNGYWQKAGIDRSIVLSTSKQILIDEKTRYPSVDGTVYDDILLEFIGDKEGSVPGWAVKPLMADYIAYCIVGLRTVFLLPVMQMQHSWSLNGVDWRRRYGEKFAKSVGSSGTWTTISCPVPTSVLYRSIGNLHRARY